jgi:hypothetical protein
MGAFGNAFGDALGGIHQGTLLNYLFDANGEKLYDSEGRVLTAKKD